MLKLCLIPNAQRQGSRTAQDYTTLVQAIEALALEYSDADSGNDSGGVIDKSTVRAEKIGQVARELKLLSDNLERFVSPGSLGNMEPHFWEMITKIRDKERRLIDQVSCSLPFSC